MPNLTSFYGREGSVKLRKKSPVATPRRPSCRAPAVIDSESRVFLLCSLISALHISGFVQKDLDDVDTPASKIYNTYGLYLRKLMRKLGDPVPRSQLVEE